MRRTIVGAVVVGLIVAALPAAGQGCVGTTCNGTMCTLTATLPTMVGSMVVYNLKVTPAAVANNATCVPAGYFQDNMAPFAIVLMATANGANPSCNWPLIGSIQNGAVTFACSVNNSDGLPVELMEFEVEGQPAS